MVERVNPPSLLVLCATLVRFYGVALQPRISLRH